MTDPIFAERRLARIYDDLDPDRSDLDPYLDVVKSLQAASVLDIGCGTGTFACLLADRGVRVTGLDPAAASLEVARAKPGAGRVTWLLGGPSDLPRMGVDVVTMTANVAQVFLTDDDWSTVLRSATNALNPGGCLIFETRDPARRAWLEWNRQKSFRRSEIPGAGWVQTWVDLVDVQLPLAVFCWTFRFETDGSELTSVSTLRFRSRDEIEKSLQVNGFVVDDVRDAPDRPGKEFIFVARKALSQ